MDLIVAVLLWMGVIQPGQAPTQDVINRNREAIVQYSKDTDFLDDNPTFRTADHIGMLDLHEGD